MPFSKEQQCGLGLRQELVDELLACQPKWIQFLEIAPENWMNKGGRYRQSLERVREHYPFIAHGLSLSIGGVAPLDEPFLQNLKRFFDRYQISVYSEHLSFSSLPDGNLFDLMPLPFTEEAVLHVADRIKQVESILERPLILENPSYYHCFNSELSELEFIKAVLAHSGAKLLLDVNNVYVNSQNHGYCPKAFIDGIDPSHISYLHVAGHACKESMIIDTHGTQVSEPVWDLLAYVYKSKGLQPTLLERDSNLPPLNELLDEMHQIKSLQEELSLDSIT
jgi:uncharacterized protein (UPF0276 family)